MARALLRRFLRDRRAATAVVMAVMIIPMILAAGAAYDFARAAAARAQLQAAVDGAALAGVGAYITEASGSNASTVAINAFNDAQQNAGVVALDHTQLRQPVVGCTSTSASVCGTGETTQGPGACSSGTYCVTVTATAVQTNALFFNLSSEPITVSSTAQETLDTSSTPGTPLPFTDQWQAYYSASGGGFGGGKSGGGVNIGHSAGVGAGTPANVSNAAGFDPAVFFIDGINSALPPASITYAKEQPSGIAACAGPSPSITGSSDQLYTVPGGTYCGNVTLGNPPTEEWNDLTGWSGTPMKVINGSLTVAPETIVCPEILNLYAYSGTGVAITDPCETHGVNPSTGRYTPIYFGQTIGGNAGSLVRNYDIDITPSTGNNGLITIVSDEAATIQSSNSGFVDNLGAAVCPGGATSCSNGVSAPVVTYSGIGTVTFHSTYIYSETYKQGVPVAWTEQKIMASTFAVPGRGTQENTQIAQAAGNYNAGVAQPLVSADKVSSGYAPSPYAVNNGAGDAYTQLNAACSAAAASGKIGGTGAIGNTVGVAPATPAVAPLSVPNAGNLFALATDMPPSGTPPPAYNFTDPNEGASFISANEEGAVLLTHTAYFCGNGDPLSVSSGGANGIVVSSNAPSGGGATLTN